MHSELPSNSYTRKQQASSGLEIKRFTMEDIADVSIAEDSATNLLPNEILSRIFAILPLRARKSVRLVCRLWYFCSTNVSIIKHEKFVFRTGFSIEDVAKVMLKSSYLVLNLEFQGLPISSLPAYTWKVCGQRIQTLEFFDCQWNDKTIHKIILHCENLTSFILETSFCRAKHNLGKILCSPRLLNELIAKGIRRTKLHTFAMFIDDVQLPESVFSKIFQIYPCINHFSTGTVSFEDSFTYCLVLHLGKQPVFSRLDRCLKSVTQLESLTFNLPTNGNWMETLIDSDGRGLRLKHLETMLLYRKSMQDTLFNFFKSQRSLEVIRLGVAEADNDEVKKLFFHILASCPRLQEFRLKTEPCDLDLERSEVPRFITAISQLKFLSLKLNVNDSEADAPSYDELIGNSVQLNLTSLKWHNYDMNFSFCAVLLQRCSFLQHLELTACSDANLQIIFEHLLELRTLVLIDVEENTDFGFTGRDVFTESTGYSIKRLQQLKYLELRGFGWDLTEEFVLEIQLPELEFLSLNVGLYRKLSERVLSLLASNLPKLRVLAIEQIYDEDNMAKTIGFCRQLKNLDRLILIEQDFDYGYECDAEEMEKIFTACPQLKYVSDADGSMFLRNSFTGKILCKNAASFKFPGNVFDGEFWGLT